MEHVARYLPTIKALAEKALDMAVDASPARPREGERTRSLIEWVPAAKGLLVGEFVDVDYLESIQAFVDGQAVVFVDGMGHRRPQYPLLAAGLHRSSFSWTPPAHSHDAHVLQALIDMDQGRFAFELVLLQAAVIPDEDSARDLIEIASLSSDEAGYLHTPDFEVAPDEWTYSELSGLHGLFVVAGMRRDDALIGRARKAALYHLHHTQPDYTTNQPWALAAFLWFPETVGFAEQQLHDVQTHLSIEGPAGALVPGLLLADAYATLRELIEKPSE